MRFVSAEPLLSRIDLGAWLGQMWRCRGCGGINGQHTGSAHCFHCGARNWPLPVLAIDWLICGGESGAGARPMHPDWARSLRDQCSAEGVPFFYKQWGEWGPAPWRVDRDPGESDEDYKTRAEATCATHAYAAWADRYGHEPHKAGHRPWSVERTSLPDGQAPIRRWGKSRSGRELDGREWSQFPHAAEMTGAA